MSGEKIRFRGHDLHAQAHIAVETLRRLTEGLVTRGASVCGRGSRKPTQGILERLRVIRVIALSPI